MNTEMENTEELVRKLEQSPLFNVSLASKELFHSNFIYWISQVNKDIFKDIMAELLGVKSEDLKWGDHWEVRREYEHFDLCVVNSVQNLFKDKAGKKQKNKDIVLFVLENKVKSIPYKKQLDNYFEKCRTEFEDYPRHYLLLSLSNSFPDKKAIEEENKWIIKNYGDLSKCLKDKISDITSEVGNVTSLTQTYIKDIVRDYCNYIETLQQFMNIWISDFENGDSYLKQTYLEDYKTEKKDLDRHKKQVCECATNTNNMSQIARKLRIHDVYGKVRVAILKQKLEKYLDEKLKDKIQRYKNDGLILEVANEYTNATPLLEVIFKQKGNGILKESGDEFFWLHIQLQGYQYRHAIYEVGNNVEESVKNISENINYHFFLYPYLGDKNETLEQECEYPKLSVKENGGIEKSFAGVTYEITQQELDQRGGVCKYGGKGRNFIYQWKRITEDSTIEDIFNAILTDIYNVLSHIDKFYYHINDGNATNY